MTFRLNTLSDNFEHIAHLLQEIATIANRLETKSYVPSEADIQACRDLRQALEHT